MAKTVKNQSLTKARAAGQDEFYTQLSDIEYELKHYKKHFKGQQDILTLGKALNEPDRVRISGQVSTSKHHGPLTHVEWLDATQIQNALNEFYEAEMQADILEQTLSPAMRKALAKA